MSRCTEDKSKCYQASFFAPSAAVMDERENKVSARSMACVENAMVTLGNVNGVATRRNSPVLVLKFLSVIGPHSHLMMAMLGF